MGVCALRQASDFSGFGAKKAGKQGFFAKSRGKIAAFSCVLTTPKRVAPTPICGLEIPKRVAHWVS
jgi:hypothetical protein